VLLFVPLIKSEINETYVAGLNPTVQDFQPRFKRNFFLSARNEAKIKLQQQNSQTKEIDIDLHDKHDRHGNQNSEINMYEHLKVKPDGNLNVVNIMQYEQQVNLHSLFLFFH
jgi:hypothetical protein